MPLLFHKVIFVKLEDMPATGKFCFLLIEHLIFSI